MSTFYMIVHCHVKHLECSMFHVGTFDTVMLRLAQMWNAGAPVKCYDAMFSGWLAGQTPHSVLDILNSKRKIVDIFVKKLVSRIPLSGPPYRCKIQSWNFDMSTFYMIVHCHFKHLEGSMFHPRWNICKCHVVAFGPDVEGWGPGQRGRPER